MRESDGVEAMRKLCHVIELAVDELDLLVDVAVLLYGQKRPGVRNRVTHESRSPVVVQLLMQVHRVHKETRFDLLNLFNEVEHPWRPMRVSQAVPYYQGSDRVVEVVGRRRMNKRQEQRASQKSKSGPRPVHAGEVGPESFAR